MKTSRSMASGVSLIELMIALAIGLILLLGLVEVFSASRTAYKLSTGLARVQENGRFALDFLQRDLRMAGHLGCVNDQSRFMPANVTPSSPALASSFLTAAQQSAGNYGAAVEALRFDWGIQGYDAKTGGGGAATGSGSALTLTTMPAVAAAANEWAPALSDAMWTALHTGSGNPVRNSDIVALRFFSPTGSSMQSFTPGDPAQITFSNPRRLQQGDSGTPGLYALGDCMNAAVFEAKTATLPATGNGTIAVRSDGLNKVALLGNQPFVTGQAMVYRAESVVYYIGLNANNNPSLYRVRFTAVPGAAGVTANKEELVEGVESLQLQYGQDSRTAATETPSGNIGSSVLANGILPDATLADGWRRVGLIQVGLLARSPDSAATTQRSTDEALEVPMLSVLGVSFAPPDDRRYRNTYETSIALRNRLFGN